MFPQIRELHREAASQTQTAERKCLNTLLPAAHSPLSLQRPAGQLCPRCSNSLARPVSLRTYSRRTISLESTGEKASCGRTVLNRSTAGDVAALARQRGHGTRPPEIRRPQPLRTLAPPARESRGSFRTARPSHRLAPLPPAAAPRPGPRELRGLPPAGPSFAVCRARGPRPGCPSPCRTRRAPPRARPGAPR